MAISLELFNDGIPDLPDPRPLSANPKRDGLSNNDTDRNADPRNIMVLQQNLGLYSWRVDPLVEKYLANPFTNNSPL